MNINECIGRIPVNNIHKIVLSKSDKSAEFRKITLSKTEKGYRVEKLTEVQAFHETVEFSRLEKYLCGYLGKSMMQLNAWDGENEYFILVSKNGKASYKKVSCGKAPVVNTAHDRAKKTLIAPGEAASLFYHMGITSSEGKVLNAMRSKLAQIDRFVQIVDEAVDKNLPKSLYIIDTGCGKSYLSFVLYHYFKNVRKIDVNVTGIDLRTDVIEKCRGTAAVCGFGGMSFTAGDIKDFVPQKPVDMVVSLHACDIATDYALYNAIKWKAKYIFAAPCCQHELNGKIQSENFKTLTKYGLIKERAAALITDAVRAEILESQGYKTHILEFADLGHTPKNLLIRAVRTGAKADISNARRLMDEFGTSQKLYDMIFEAQL